MTLVGISVFSYNSMEPGMVLDACHAGGPRVHDWCGGMVVVGLMTIRGAEMVVLTTLGAAVVMTGGMDAVVATGDMENTGGWVVTTTIFLAAAFFFLLLNSMNPSTASAMATVMPTMMIATVLVLIVN